MTTRSSTFVLLAAIIMALSMWFFVDRILVPHQIADAAIRSQPRGILSDLYPRWIGARELLLHGRDPYSEEVTLEIQRGYYGRVLDLNRPNDPKDEQRFAYPVYVVFLLAPTIHLPFPILRVGFTWFLVVATACSVLMWMRTLRWQSSCMVSATAVFLTLGSFPAVQGIKLQQLSLVVSALIAGSALAIAADQLFLSGVLLAIATIKPQLAIPYAAWLLLWTLGDWRRRQKFAWGFGSTLLALMAGGEYILPGWIGRFRDGIAAYHRYTAAGSLLDVLLTPRWGFILTVLIVLAVAATAWIFRRVENGTAVFDLMSAFVLSATVVVVPMIAPYNQLLLLPAILIALKPPDSLAKSRRIIRLLNIGVIVAITWPWLATTTLMLASIWASPQVVQRALVAPILTTLAIPLLVAALLSSHVWGTLSRTSVPTNQDSET